MQVGTTKEQGLYNKPSDAVHPGALAAGTLLQYNIIQYNTLGELRSLLEMIIILQITSGSEALICYYWLH